MFWVGIKDLDKNGICGIEDFKRRPLYKTIVYDRKFGIIWASFISTTVEEN